MSRRICKANDCVIRSSQRGNKIYAMITVIQRVASAFVEIEGNVKSKIDEGLLVLVGIEEADGAEDIEWLASKIVNLRIFNDQSGIMNVSIKEEGGEILVVSQFTLHASIRKGNRPSYIKAARPELAIPLYEKFVAELSRTLGKPVHTGTFGADMKVSFINDGPVTILIDTKNKV
jgi:D-tyrosyl-tRNA(Tyr) deacylase